MYVACGPACRVLDRVHAHAAPRALVLVSAVTQRGAMTAFSLPDQAGTASDSSLLQAAVAAYLGRYCGQSRLHTGSDLKIFLTWCASQRLDPLRVGRADIERYVRCLQGVRCYQPSTVSRRLSVVVGFYRVCVIDQMLPYSPADYVRRPAVPAESPILGLGHLQFEALITTRGRVGEHQRLRPDRDAGPARPADLRSLRCQHRRSRRGARPSGAEDMRQGRQDGVDPAAARSGRAIDRAAGGATTGRSCANTHGMRMERDAATRRLKQLADAAGIRIARMHPLSWRRRVALAGRAQPGRCCGPGVSCISVHGVVNRGPDPIRSASGPLPRPHVSASWVARR